MNNKRKNRGPVRTQRTRSVIAEGVYNNAHFMHSATLQIGNVVRIKTASGVVWEGVFKTFSSNFDVVLEVAAKVDNPNGPAQTLIADSLVDKLIFKSGDISTMEARDVDLEYPTKDTFQTDTAISARLNGNSTKSEEKELEPWDASSGVNGGGGENVPLELENANGWDANDMFRKNEQEYGVTSTFDQSLKGYTVPLRSADTADYRKAEAKATQIANEIENQPQYKARLELENGDEEAAFAAVARPNQEPNDKYIPPAKRKNQNSGKLVRSTPPPPQAQNAPSPKGTAPPPMAYPTHPSPAPVPNNVMPHMPQMGMQPQHHGRPHSHTPPHGYGGQMQRPPQMGQKAAQQMNGDAKPPMRGPRGVYPGSNNGPPQGYQEPAKAPPPPEAAMGHRHPRDDTIKELHGFAQDFKLPPAEQPPPTLPGQVPMEQMAAPPPPQVQPQPQAKPPPQNTPPQQPQQSISPQQDVVEKVTNTFKKSTLNPNAKEFVLNPAAKPFQPRYILRILYQTMVLTSTD
ncbi:hypothetical protein Zmor_016731 [Zophobas morio]|uniref:LsmAD domain-containing protein n=1 Tax=Zophobas morio TaxID=2755281 RepID=A0AA38MBA0_9CUCU|nr:hypothetical protein Zmor_016731 [Zophobas morio]